MPLSPHPAPEPPDCSCAFLGPSEVGPQQESWVGGHIMKVGGPCPPPVAHILVWAAGRRLSWTATAPSPAAQGSLACATQAPWHLTGVPKLCYVLQVQTLF